MQPYRSPDFLWPRAGLRISAVGGLGSEARMWGGSAAFRYRPSLSVGLDFGLGYLTGKDHLHRNARDIPIFVDVLLY